ncbi:MULTISPECIES: DUF2516 family protein [unclassified Actinomyces]|uniref:DUF2516 family protein n=1 Tax=unclassified Actinomyces TaxID=2609248 RepID=UPI0020182AA1|nr:MULTISPECIES: DUF2516 family protein [unclassified Actinomyces]MCL3778684.1 DUF2516 family protein [Actinomyces sp. AC-20-1]MCL3789965.1 DUF2516 family protein [Actinomyces sp. 187325]MCL3792316.1 DUF2516 family protein [Actinomyces sp. 186855]MCL3794506.1 DUF2516 family protein [Actinomyces sp. 217892]
MSPLAVVAVIVARSVRWIWFGVQVAAGLMGLWALVDCLTRDPQHFLAAGKRTKGFWIGVNAAGLAVVIIMGAASMLGLLGVVANAVYLADVRPALDLYKPVRVRSQLRRPGEDPRPGGTGPGWRR